MTIGIVTDSTAYLPENFISANAIEVIPVQVIIAGQTRDDSAELLIEEVVSQLRAGNPVTTARPGVQTFLTAYEKLIQSGATEILSIHLSSKLSGTFESALLASKQIKAPVTVIDSKGIAGALAHCVSQAVDFRNQGLSITQIELKLNQAIEQRKMYFYVDTLEFLARGGRISNLKSKIGHWLTVKPILKLENGNVEVHELVRTEEKALYRLIELAVENGRDHSYLINHVAGAQRAALIAEAIADTLKINPVPITSAGAVVGAHVGPGTVAVVID